MAAFLEENVMPADSMDIDGTSTMAPDLPTAAASTTSAAAAVDNSINLLRNGISIERRVKQELIDQGLLDPEDFANEDEILSEIMRVRTELAAIAEHNHTELQKLQSAAKEEMKRLEIKRKLDSVDQEVCVQIFSLTLVTTYLLYLFFHPQIIEMYKKVVNIKVKRRALTEPEREEVFRLTEEQKRLSDLLDSMPAPGPNFSAAQY